MRNPSRTARVTLAIAAILIIATAGAPAVAATHTPGSGPDSTPYTVSSATLAQANNTTTTTAPANNTTTTTTAAGENNTTAANQPTGTAVDAEIGVYPPRWVDQDTRKVKRNGSIVWLVYSQYTEITLKNIPHETVTSFGIREDEALLNYDKGINRYVLNSQGATGTFHLYWVVSNGNSTTRYQAIVSVERTDYVHVPRERYTVLKNGYENWTDVYDRFQDAGDSDVPVSDKIDRAITVINFVDNPLSALTGQFSAILTLLAFTPGGWLFDAILIALVYFLTRGLYRTIARYRKQMEDVEDVERREELQHIKNYKQGLGGEVWSDIDAIDDHQSAAYERVLGPNLYTALNNFVQTFGPTRLKRMYLEAMSAVGYKADVYRAGNGDVESVEVYQSDGTPTADGGSATTVPLADVDQDVADAIPWSEIDHSVLDENADISAVDTLMAANRDADGDIVEELNIRIPEDFQDRYEFMVGIGAFLQHVLKSDFTDDEGVPRRDRGTLNNLFVFTTVMDQMYDVPLDLYWRAALWNAENLSVDDRVSDVLDEAKDADQIEQELERDLGIRTGEPNTGHGLDPGADLGPETSVDSTDDTDGSDQP